MKDAQSVPRSSRAIRDRDLPENGSKALYEFRVLGGEK
jgi:hypothetical protein